MTKSKVLREYLKKFYNVDSDGMSLLQIHKDFMKKHFNYDSNATSFISAIRELIDNDLAPGDSGGDDSHVVVDVLPQVEEADPDKLYLVPMIDAWYNGSLSRCFITQNERPSYADDFMAFGTIVVESGDAVMIGSDGTRNEVVMHEYETEAQGESQAGDSKYHCSPETFHYKVFKIVTNEFGTFWGLAEAPSWVVEAE